MAGAIALGVLAAILVLGLPDDSDLFLTLFLALGMLSLVFTGSALTGALMGAAAGRGADGPLSGLGAGALAGVVGQFVVIFAVFVGFAILGAAEEPAPEDEDAFFEEPDDDGPFEWGEFGQALLVLVPSGIAAALAGFATSPWSDRPRVADASDGRATARAPTEERRPNPSMRDLRCPACHHVFRSPVGQPPECPACGHGG